MTKIVFTYANLTLARLRKQGGKGKSNPSGEVMPMEQFLPEHSSTPAN